MQEKPIPVGVPDLYFEADRVVSRWIVAADLKVFSLWWKKDEIIPDAFDTSWSFADPEDLHQDSTYVNAFPVEYVRRPAIQELGSQKLASKITLATCKLSNLMVPPVGVLIFYNIDWEQKSFWLRNYIEPRSRGHRLGWEQYISAFEFAFDELHFEKVTAGVKKPNLKNQKVCRGIGMEDARVREKHLPVAGVLRDSVDFVMTRERWERGKAYMQEHHVRRILYTRLQSPDADASIRKVQDRISCLQMAEILYSCSRP